MKTSKPRLVNGSPINATADTELLQEGVSAELTSAFRRLYRIAKSAWAGGNHTVVVTTGDPSASTTTQKVWSKNGKWSGLDATTTIQISDYAAIPVDLRVVEDLLTLAASPITTDDSDEEAWTATWMVQSRGLAVSTEHGVIYRRRSRSGGAWLPYVHASSLTGARSVTSRLLTIARAS